MKRNGFSPVIIIILVLVILVGGYFLLPANIKNAIFSFNPQVSNTPKSSSNPEATTTPVQGSLFTGKLTKLNQDLKLFKITEDMQMNGRSGGFVYYSAGKFVSGDLAGYTRIIATQPQEGPGTPAVYTLATKDFTSYIFDDPNDLTNLPSGDFNNPYSYLDKSKITSVAKFDTDQPISISLDNHFSLYFDNFFTTSAPGTSKDKFGQSIYETTLRSDFVSFQKLASPNANIALYFEKPEAPVNKYVLGDTKVIIVDSTGLPKVYSITTPNTISEYKVKLDQYNIAYKQYTEDLKKYSNKEISTYPASPKYAYPPSMGFNGSDIVKSANKTFYNDYETAFPGACAFDLDTRVVNVNDSDLEQVGTINNLPVFALKDQNSDLNTQEYNEKMAGWGNGMDFATNNPGMPTNLADYIKKTPLLFIKDYWGRWIAVGEWDVKLAGGCGKPVIYLYPQKDTTVTVKFGAPVSFTTDIPTYGDYWQVLARTNGTLTNLRSNLTDCSKFDGLIFGSEYAKESCLTNSYPYLFWSGNATSINYPKANGGWIVAKDDLQSFIDSKLTYMGLNTKEKSDFESYWVPEMLGKNSNFYRVSFFNTQEVNQLFPMTVTPTPDSIFRIFMDWQPLSQKPEVLPLPQTLEQVVRHGFTMVEWGGLK